MFINKKVHTQESQNGSKSEKKKVIPKEFDSVYMAEKAIVRVNYGKHLIDLTLNSPRIKISQSEIIIIDNRGFKKSFASNKNSP